MGSLETSVDDLAEVLVKYEEECQKRLRPDGMAQYADIVNTEKFAHFANDPWVDESNPYIAQPCPLSNGSHVKVLVVGAGYGALLFAVRLITEAGFKPEDFVFVDSAWGFGGTWYWNRYPGLMCDVESACYLPLAEEMDYIPKHRYSYGPELRNYAELVAKKWQLQQRAVFGSTIKTMSWQDSTSVWEISITRQLPGDSNYSFNVSGDFVILASGILNRPKLARLDGIETYHGHMFHTSRWDYAYTGGTPEDPSLKSLIGKKVAFIGTGATAIQAIPQLAKWADQLYVFQRTPSAVDSRGQRPVDADQFQREVQIGKGWQQARRENMASFLSNVPHLPAKDLVDDGWTHFPSFSGLLGSPRAAGLTLETLGGYIESLHRLDLPRQSGIRSRINKIVKDPATSEALLPWYAGWCKRPCFHDDYLDTFNLPDVHLVDTAGKGVDGFDERGVVYGGTTYDADVVILGTGFEPYSVGSPAYRASISITGRGGLSMDHKWDQGPRTLHGVITRDFPNLLLPGLTQGAATTNIVHSIDVLARHAAFIMVSAQRKLNIKDDEKLVIEPTEQAELDWSLKVAGNALAYAAVPGCTPSYGTAEGTGRTASTPEDQLKIAQKAPWGMGIVDFTRMMEAWEAKGDLSELDAKAVRK